MNKFCSEHFAGLLVAIAALALVLRLTPLMRSGIEWAMWYDSPVYVALAGGIRAGCGFAFVDGTSCLSPENFRTPGYPMFLALLPSLRSAVVAQGILGALVCLALGLFGRRVWGAAAGVAAAVLMAIDLPSINASSQILADSLLQSVLAFAILAVLAAAAEPVNGWRGPVLGVTSGLLLGSAILIKPIAQFLPPLFALPPLLASHAPLKRRLLLIGLAAGLSSLICLGWIQRNAVLTGQRTLSTITPFDLYYFKAAGVLQFHDGGSFKAAQDELAKRVGASRPVPPADPHVLPRIAAQAEKIIFHHPLAYAAMTLEDLIFVLCMPERRPLASHLDPKAEPGPWRLTNALAKLPASPAQTVREIYRQELDSSPLFAALFIMQLPLNVLMLLGVALAVNDGIKHPGRSALLIFFLLAVALTLLIPAAGPEASARLRLPAMPSFAMLAAAGWLRARGGGVPS